MAVFESGLFSRLSGSFGNVTMYRLGDSNVVKGKKMGTGCPYSVAIDTPG